MIDGTKLISYLLILIFFPSFCNISIGQAVCDIIHNGIDLQTKTYRTELAPGLLFSYTPPEIKNDLQEENLLIAKAQVVKVEDKTTLHLNLVVNSQQAQAVYGTIGPTFIMKVILIDGKEVELKCYAGSEGVLSSDQKHYIYPVGYDLTNRDIRLLSRKEMDKIGIQWSSGYEEYIIYEVDFFMNQLACLKQATDQKPN